jgi:iron complex transport system substrate-binding protein
VTSLFHKEKISKPECRIYLHRRSRLRTTDGKEYFVLRFFRAISLFSFLLVSLCGFGSPARSSQTVVDDLGRRIVLPHGAQRIVTLTPSATEILYAVGAGSKVVGVDNYSNYPASVARVTKLDGLNPSREVLASLRPDLIVISDQTMTFQKAQQESRLYGAPLFVTNASNYTGVELDIAKMGADFGSAAQAAKVTRSMQSTLLFVQKKIAGRPRPSVFVAIWTKPLMTAGGSSFISNLVWLAGGNDIAAKSAPYSNFSLERLVVANPQIIITGALNVQSVKSAFKGLNLRSISANHVYGLPEDISVRPGPRLAQGLMRAARMLHPEAFAGK